MTIHFLPALFLLSIPKISTVPIESKALLLDSSHFDRLINSVARRVAENDVIFPSVCPPACEHLHRAITVSNSTDQKTNCSCVCPASRPAYVSTIGACVGKLNECPNSIQWSSEPSAIPVVRLHAHSIILPDSNLDFNGAGIQNGDSNCNIIRILYENIQTRWKPLAKELVLFQLTSSNGKPILYFGGTDVDANFLAGSVVMIKLECRTVSTSLQQFCISLRIAGTSGNSMLHNNRKHELDDVTWRIETTFLFIVIITIVIVLVCTFIVWNICWGIKKRKLINDFQKQFVQQYRNNQSQEFSLTAKISDEMEGKENNFPQSFSRKRLIFSTEYFDHSQMTQPSPLAEQFLSDLRRVVDFARERIRQRRFSPTLSVISEEEDVTDEPDLLDVSPQYSPQSEQKSVDSGRESKENSDEDNDEKPGQTPNVAAIVKSFEKSAPRPSYVPIMLNSSMRKKNLRKMSIPSTEKPTSATGNSENTRQIRPPSNISERCMKDRRKYAVFPSDGTFNKSLPRRVKRVPQNAPE